ncbi:uncharacterized protein LOC128391435 [Panonychus citri]|uniref:uncharacterized protein LOC128391435 n=1 Tax=Panonychus citri TaxID=50023 RepID=UPI0023074C0C|nr:uncharacterized protein LOC128391435 [Panonychus citri]
MFLIYCFVNIFLIIATIFGINSSSNPTESSLLIPSKATLINYAFNDRPEKTWYFEPKKCGEFHVYDKVAGKCRRIYCRSTIGDMPYRKCKVSEAFESFYARKEFIDIQAEKWSIKIFVNIINGLKLTRNKNTRKEFEMQLASVLNISIERIGVEDMTLLDNFHAKFDVELFEDIEMDISAEQLAEKMRICLTERQTFQIDGCVFQPDFAASYLTSYVSTFCEGSSVRKIPHWGLNFSFINSNKLLNNENGRIYPKGSYIASVLVHNDLLKVVTFAILCEKVTGLFCETFKLPAGSYEFIDNGAYIKSLYGVTDKFEVDFNSSVKICEPSHFFCVGNQTENKIVGVCLIVSCVFLVLILVTFSMVPDISSTLPGFNTINLVLTILILQLHFLTGAYWTNCWLAAIVMHYFILLNFSWSSIIGFHIFRTFVTCDSIHCEDNSKYGSRFTSFIMAHLMVLIVVAVSLINEFISNDFAPHFGPFQGVCWIRSSIGILIYFAVPISLSNSLNSIFYLASYMRIKRTLNASVAVSVQSINRLSIRSIPTQLSVFSRIATALSISWLTILLIPMTPPKSTVHQLAKYLFVFINTNQGLLLFFAFLWNKRVGRIWLNWARILIRIENQKSSKDSIVTISASVPINSVD